MNDTAQETTAVMAILVEHEMLGVSLQREKILDTAYTTLLAMSYSAMQCNVSSVSAESVG